MKASITQIKCYKACPRSWELKYHEGLLPVNTSEALVTGKAYHQLLEELEGGVSLADKYPDVFTKEMAMARAYEKYIFPKFKVVAAEKELEKNIGSHVLHGFVDGLSDDGYIVEHKTTSRDISEYGEYEYSLLWDEQVLAYMSLSGLYKVHYTVCKKPTIRIKKDESEEEFFKRMLEWYDVDTDQKIRVFTVERTPEEVEQFESDFEQICDAIEGNKFFYRNTCHCSAYGRRCEYSSVCLHYDPNQEYIEFYRKENEDAVKNNWSGE